MTALAPSAVRVMGWAASLAGVWPSVHQRLRDALFALFIVGLLAYGAAFAWYMLTRFDLVNLLRDVSIDDTFYYFQIAYHMAEGKFSTFDGGITRTNGYHPLWLFLITPFYWVFDKMEALFAVKAFEIMLVAGGVALVAVAARVARLPWILLLAALPALYAQRAMLLGLEAALVLFMLGLLILATCLFARQPARWRWPLAALAFALPWARLELAAVAVAVTGALCLLEWSGRFPTSMRTDATRGFPRRGRNLRSLAPLVAAVGGLLAYFAYNGIVFGGIVPVSAATKMMWSQLNWGLEGGYSLVENFRVTAQLRPFDDELFVALEVAAYALLVWWLSGRLASRERAGGGAGRESRGRESEVLLPAFMAGVFGLAAGHLAKFAQSVFLVHPFFATSAWYYVPAYLLEALVVPVRCFVGIYALRWIGAALPRAADVVYFAGVAAVAVVLVAKADFAAPFRFVDAHRNSDAHDYHLPAYMGVAVMNRVLPTDALVGSWDAGIAGYFARFPVVNLDGLANSYDYLQTRQRLIRQAEAAGDLQVESSWQGLRIERREHVLGSSRLVDQLGLSYVGNVFLGDERYDDTPHRASLAFKTYQAPDAHFETRRRHFSLYCFRDGCSSWFTERMASRLEPQPDGARLVVSGRVAQAFATQCAADDVAAWAWGLPEERTLSAWTRNPDGSCSSFLMLPHGHLPPLRVRRLAYGKALAYLVGRQAPEIQAKFDVFQVGDETGRRLIYARKTCDRADVKTRFFLHLVPVGDDWDAGRESFGFNNADFMLEEHGSWAGEFGSPCLAEVPLPEYRIAKITTGQFTSAGRVWDGEILP